MREDVTIVNITDQPFEAVRRGRVNSIRRKPLPLDSGVPGCTLEFTYVIVPEGYFTPRHRHNFDQIRYTLSGIQSTALGDLAPGECGYFPEGAYYGPQEQAGDAVALVLQYQGASGEHLLSNEEMNGTYQRILDAGGVFENGIYKGLTTDGRKKNKDSYLAIWEEHEGKKLTFPAARYRHPVMMIEKNYRWIPDRKRPGIETKHLGTFTELRTGVSFLRLTPGASLPATKMEDSEIRFLLSGSVDYRGKEWGENTYFFNQPDAEMDAISSKGGATFFTISLPMIAELRARLKDRAGAEAQQAAE